MLPQIQQPELLRLQQGMPHLIQQHLVIVQEKECLLLREKLSKHILASLNLSHSRIDRRRRAFANLVQEQAEHLLVHIHSFTSSENLQATLSLRHFLLRLVR